MRAYLLVVAAILVFSIPAHAVDGFNLPGSDYANFNSHSEAKECVASDLKLELGSRENLVAGMTACEGANDYVSREIFKKILEDTEAHIDWLETQLDVMRKVGIQNWLQSQM